VIESPLDRARQDADSVLDLAQRLIQIPSQGGVDDYTPVLEVLEHWLTSAGLPARQLVDEHQQLVGLVCEIPGERPGPTWVLDACVDTAPFGSEHAWSIPPTSGEIRDGWLWGRGAADSKTAAAVFCHIAAAVARQPAGLAGQLAVLLDADEHTGDFGGAKSYFTDPANDVAGVMIGYPGLDEVVVGGRGVLRAYLHVHGTAGHSGSSSTPPINAIARAARLTVALTDTELPAARPDGFPLPPKLTVTQITGGTGFSVIADHCVLGVDVRLTDVLTAPDTEKLLHAAGAALDATDPAPRPTTVEVITNWPPFQLAGDEQPAAALLKAARAVHLNPQPRVAGPSNIGNYLAGLGIPATAGFGPHYTGLHGTDERVRLAELPSVQAAYHHAILELLSR
jgi:succinyl-diaminopimelate desuccinylase